MIVPGDSSDCTPYQQHGYLDELNPDGGLPQYGGGSPCQCQVPTAILDSEGDHILMRHTAPHHAKQVKVGNDSSTVQVHAEHLEAER